MSYIYIYMYIYIRIIRIFLEMSEYPGATFKGNHESLGLSFIDLEMSFPKYSFQNTL